MGCEIVPIKSSNEIERRVRELGIQIAHDYSGRDLVLIGILKGAFIFLGDLARAITMPLTIDFIRVESYKNTSSTGTVRIITDLTQPIEGKHVLVVDDIVDTGITMDFLLRNLKTRRPASGGTGDATLSGASISGSDFSSGSVDAVTKQITTTSHTLQTFYDFVIKSLGALISNKATLTVNPDVPAFEYACYVGFCYECDSGASPPSASCRVVNNQVCKNQTPSKDCKVEIRE